MPGRQRLQALGARIEGQGGEAVIFDRIADGETITAICRTYSVSRRMIYNWIHAGGEDREHGWKLAKELSAEAHAEKAGEVLEDVAGGIITTADVSLAGKRSAYHQWLAGKRNRKEFGEDAGKVNVQVNVLADLHLDALRKAGSMSTNSLPSPNTESIEEAEVLAVLPAASEVEELVEELNGV